MSCAKTPVNRAAASGRGFVRPGPGWAMGSPREGADSEPGGQFRHLAAEAGGVRAGQPGRDRGHRPLDGEVAGAPGALDVRADHPDVGRLAATGERAEDVVDEGGAELGIE